MINLDSAVLHNHSTGLVEEAYKFDSLGNVALAQAYKAEAFRHGAAAAAAAYREGNIEEALSLAEGASNLSLDVITVETYYLDLLVELLDNLLEREGKNSA